MLLLKGCHAGPRRSLPQLAPPQREVFLMGLPSFGGQIDSVVGILTGTVFGIAPQRAALLPFRGVPV
jgi:hypothetical protein